MSIKLFIRSAGHNDVSAIVDLVNLAYRPASDNKGWTHEAAFINGNRTNVHQVKEAINGSVVLVGIQDEKIVACVQIEQKRGEAYISMLAVEPDLQDAGIGKMMLAEAEAYAYTSLKIDQLTLVVVSARSELIEFYLRRGYRHSGEKLPYPVHCGVGRPKDEKLDLTVLRKQYNEPLDRGAVRLSANLNNRNP